MKKNIYQIGVNLLPKKFSKEQLVKEKKLDDKIAIAKSLNIGYYLIIPILFGVFFGFWLDKHFNTKPIFLLLFLSFGILSTFYNLCQLVKKIK